MWFYKKYIVCHVFMNNVISSKRFNQNLVYDRMNYKALNLLKKLPFLVLSLESSFQWKCYFLLSVYQKESLNPFHLETPTKHS